MRYFLLIVAILAPQQSVFAREPGLDSALPPVGTVIRRSLTVPSEIAFAVVPYAQCLSDQLQRHKELLWKPNELHPAADLAKEQCAAVRDSAILLSATFLEKNGRYAVDQRREMIFGALAAIENQAFGAPAFPPSPSGAPQQPD